ALLVDHVAFFALGVDAVDQHRDRDAVDLPGFGHFGLGGVGNLVIVGFLGLLALVLGGRAALLLVARQFVVDGDLPVIVGGLAGFFAGLARAQHPAFRIELVRGLGDLVVVEIGGELDAGAAGADHRGHDRLDLIAQPLFVGRAALVADDVLVVAGLAVGQKLAGLVDDRHPLRFQAADRGGDQMTDRPD